MSIIIRLQNLPMEANSLDIRRFFQGLHIPDGGVHIVGGENGDAFIAFGGDEDARQAMERNGNLIKTSRIKLLLSSRNEMQRVIDNARTQTLGMVNPSVPSKPLGPGPQGPPNSQYGGGHHQGQYPVSSPQQQQMPPKPMNAGPNTYNQMYSGSQVAPTQAGPNVAYGIPPQQQAPKGPLNDPYQRQLPPFRSRSRSRSPPPSRMRSDLSASDQGPPPNQSGLMSSQGSMQSGLMGSLQQGPPQVQQQYVQNGAYSSSTSNGASAPQQGPYDNGNYYRQQQQQPYQSGPGGEGAKYGGQDDRWNAQPTNNMSPMLGQGQNAPPQDNYRQNEMYRNQSMPPSGPPPQSGPFQQQQQQSMPPYSSGPMHQNDTSMPLSQNQGQPQNQQQNSGRMFTLQLWNLPLNIRPAELVQFFTPLYLYEDNIKIFNDDRGFPTGLALVRFPTAREFDNALNYNGKFLGDRQIQVRPLDETVNNGVQNNLPSAQSQPPPAPQQQQNVSEPYMDPNYPPGFRASPGPIPDVPYTNTRGPPMGGGGHHGGGPPPFQGPPNQAGPNKDLAVFMKGLPFNSCTPNDVEEFFHPIRLANIEIERDTRGKPSGNAYVEFTNRHDFERGMEYNMKHMGRRYIELIPLRKLDKPGPRGGSGAFHGGPPGGPPGGGPYSGGDRNGPLHTNCISVKGLSPNITSQDLKLYFGNAGAQPFAVHIMLTPNQMNAGEAFLEFVDKDFQKRALKRDGDFIGRDRITVRPVPYEMVMNAIQRPPPGSAPPMGGGGGPPHDYYRDGKGGGRNRDRARGPPPPPFQDKAASLVAFECSSKAKDEDFCVFFEKYKISPDRLKKRINDNDTIDAQISFLSKADAEHALRNMDGKYFLGRNIRLEFL